MEERLNRSYRLRRNMNQGVSDLEDLMLENNELVRQNQLLRNTLQRLLQCNNHFAGTFSDHITHANELLASSILEKQEEAVNKPRKHEAQSLQSASSPSVPMLRKSMSASDKKTFTIQPKKTRKPRSTSGEYPSPHSLKLKANSTTNMSTSPASLPKQPQPEDSDEFSQFIVSTKNKTRTESETIPAKRSHSSASIFKERRETTIASPSRKRRRSKPKLMRSQAPKISSPEHAEWTSTMHGKDAMVVSFDAENETDYYNLVNFVDSFRDVFPERSIIEWYEGGSIVTKHGEGSFYSPDKVEPLCGMWVNDKLQEIHHEFIPESEREQHMQLFHRQQDKQIIQPSLIDSMLPEEIFSVIFGFLDLKSLLRVCVVSKKWNRLANGAPIWRTQFKSVWGKQEIVRVLSFHDGDVNWREMVRDKYVLDRNWRTGNCHTTVLHGHSGWVTCVDVHHNRLVSSSYDGTVRVWNTQTGHSLQTFGPTNMASPAWCTQFRANSIFAGYTDSIVRQWNSNTAQPVLQFVGHAGGVKSLQCDEEKDLIISGSDDKTVKLFDVRTGECVRTIQCTDSVGNIQFHGNMLLTVIKRESNVFWYDIRSGQLLRELEGHTKAVYSLQFDPLSNKLVTGSRDRDVLLWDIESGDCIQRFSGHEFTVMSVELDYKKIVSASADQSIKVWDIHSGRCISTLLKHNEVVMSIKADENKIVSGSVDKTVIVWDFLRSLTL